MGTTASAELCMMLVWSGSQHWAPHSFLSPPGSAPTMNALQGPWALRQTLPRLSSFSWCELEAQLEYC